MNKKVIVFGIKDEAPAPAEGGCGCGPAGCGPTQTMGEMYQELSGFLKSKDSDIELEFVDVFENDLDEHEDALSLMQKQFPIPYTKINGEMKFYGGISNEAIYTEIKKL